MVTLCRFPFMRLLNQNAAVQEFEPKVPGVMGSGSSQHTYSPNRHACAAVGCAMAFRSLVDHSIGRFTNINQTKPLSQVTGATPAPVSLADSFNVDFYDIALMNLFCDSDHVGCVDENENPKAPPNVFDHQFETGLGLALKTMKDFLPGAEPLFDLWVFHATETTSRLNGRILFVASFPWFSDESLISAIEQGAVVMPLFNFYAPTLAPDGTVLFDANGRPIWRDLGVGHTLVVNGFVRESPLGPMFSVYDPFGPQNPSQRSPFQRFVSEKNGFIETVQFRQSPVPVTFDEVKHRTNEPVFMVSQEEPSTDYGHPIFIVNPFAPDTISPQGVRPGTLARIMIGAALVVLMKDPSKLMCGEVPFDSLAGDLPPTPIFEVTAAPELEERMPSFRPEVRHEAAFAFEAGQPGRVARPPLRLP